MRLHLRVFIQTATTMGERKHLKQEKFEACVRHQQVKDSKVGEQEGVEEFSCGLGHLVPMQTKKSTARGAVVVAQGHRRLGARPENIGKAKFTFKSFSRPGVAQLPATVGLRPLRAGKYVIPMGPSCQPSQ